MIMFWFRSKNRWDALYVGRQIFYFRITHEVKNRHCEPHDKRLEGERVDFGVIIQYYTAS